MAIKSLATYGRSQLDLYISNDFTCKILSQGGGNGNQANLSPAKVKQNLAEVGLERSLAIKERMNKIYVLDTH